MSGPKKFDINDAKKAGKLKLSTVPMEDPSAEPWEPPVPFDQREVPPFPAGVLPPWLDEFCGKVAASTEAPFDLAAMYALTGLSLAVSGKARIQILSGWVEDLNTYLCTIVPSGEGKSPVLRPIAAPIHAYERKLAEEDEEIVARNRAQLKAVEARMRAAERALSGKNSGDRDTQLVRTQELAELEQEKGRIGRLQARRVLCEDATPEALQTLLELNSGRMGMLSAEGGPFELMAGRYSKNGQANLGVYLKGHTGEELRIDRIGRPSQFIEHPLLTIGLAVQPRVLMTLAENPAMRGLGLNARFLYSYPKSKVGFRQFSAPPLRPSDCHQYSQLMGALLGERYPETESEIPVIPFDDEAGQAVLEFRRWLEPKMRPGAELGSFADWANKLSGHVSRIAGVLHVARMLSGEQEYSPAAVGVATVRAGIELGKYFIAHAAAAFELMGESGEAEGARKVLAWLDAKQVRRFSRRDAQRALCRQFATAEQLAEALRVLEDRLYVRQLPLLSSAGTAGGRPAIVYEVNPAVLEGATDGLH